MSGQQLSGNPFAALFGTSSAHGGAPTQPASRGAPTAGAAVAAVPAGQPVPAAAGPASMGASAALDVGTSDVSSRCAAAAAAAGSDRAEAQLQLQLSYYYERVLLATLDDSTVVVGPASQRPQYCIFLPDLRDSLQQDWIDLDVFGQVLFDRLLVPDAGAAIVRTSALASGSRPAGEADSKPLTEHRVMHFLYQCYRRTVTSRVHHESAVGAAVVATCQEVVVDTAVTCLLQPDIFSGQPPPAEQLADIVVHDYFSEDAEILQAMLDKLVAALLRSADDSSSDSAAAASKPAAVQSVAVCAAFQPLLLRIWRDCGRQCLGQLPVAALSGACAAGADVLVLFTRHACLGELLIDFSTPTEAAVAPSAASSAAAAQGVYYEQSLLGLLLSGSSMPSRFGSGGGGAQLQLYSDVAQLTQAEIGAREASTWQGLVRVTEKAYGVFHALLRLSPDVKHRLLSWIGACLQANSGRTKLAAMLHDDGGGAGALHDCSDGFMLNLSAVLLRLCAPFVGGSGGGRGGSSTAAAAGGFSQRRRLLGIQPEYCLYQHDAAGAAGDQERRRQGHHAPSGLASQTCLVPREDAASVLPEPTEYSGVTEFFFLAQAALHLGFHVSVEKFFKSNNDLGRLQGAYQQARQSLSALGSAGSGQEAAVKMMFENEMRKFLCMKATLTEPDYLESCLRFHAASAAYLVHLASADGSAAAAEGQEQPTPAVSLSASTPKLRLPLRACSARVRAQLSCIPEFVITNIADAITLVKRFKEPLLHTLGADGLGNVMDLILVFMGSKERLKNPHLRAKLAIVLEELLPLDALGGGGGGSFATAFSGKLYEELFTSHRNISCLAETLINVFVSIEMTGEGVRFEEKFNYRRPMYKVMDYMWSIEVHKRAIKELCSSAEAHMADVDPPLFLRFINLLVNDAIYLLDEALSYMRQIREKEEEQEQRRSAASTADGPSGGGAASVASAAGRATVTPRRSQLLEQQRQQHEQDAMAQHTSMLARFHNMLGADTIHTLALLTAECQSIFCHHVMVDRVAAMLNYFLLHLTGPNMKQFKVKNFEKYDFKPRLVVSNICQIYLNLAPSPAFCAAVSGDGRSYSASLFPQAARVLHKIGKPVETIDAFNELAVKIQAAASRQQEEDACLGDVPDEFLDPIMGTLMRDPVTLPSSRVVVDRSTIARHVLSDQTDPFNRSPLSMDMVEPNDALRERVRAWLASKLHAA